MKTIVVAFAGLTLAAGLLAELVRYKDWEKSPEAYFLTPSERSEWKALSTDAETDRFVALYWARRGGEPFQQDISRRIAAADQQFKLPHYSRGADSVRGRLLIVLGRPSKVVQRPAGEGGPGVTLEEGAVFYTWVYDKDQLSRLGLPGLEAQVVVDPRRGVDTLPNPAPVEKALATAAEKSIVNPGATIASKSVPPPAIPAMPLPAAARASLLAAPDKGAGDASFWSGVFRSPSGDRFLAVQFYLPSDKPVFSSGAPLRLGGVVSDAGGKEVATFWEDAAFAEVAEAGRKDRVLDRSVALPPGDYRGVFALFAAEGESPVTSSSVSFQLDPKSSDFGVSPLILSNGLFPQTKRPGPTEPFVFGTEKPIKVEPKGDHLFSSQDSLWYFYAIENPVAPAAAGETAPAAEAPKPRIMTRVAVEKDGRDAFRPSTAPAELVELGPGYYSAGVEIPLGSFEPGYYTFGITVRDLNAPRGSPGNSGIQRKQDFVVLMPDGSLPPKPAAAPTPKPKKP